MSTMTDDILGLLCGFAFVAFVCILFHAMRLVVNSLSEYSFQVAPKEPNPPLVEAPKNIHNESLLVRFQDDLISVRRPKAYDDIVKLLREATYVPTYKRIRVFTTLPETTEEILVSPSVWELICAECKEIKVAIEVDNDRTSASGSAHRGEHDIRAYQASATRSVRLAALSAIATEDAPSEILSTTTNSDSVTPLYMHGHFDFRFRSYPLETVRSLKLRFGAQYGLDIGSFDLYDGGKMLPDEETVGGANLAKNATLRIHRHGYTLSEEEQEEEEEYERLVPNGSAEVESIKSE